MVYHNGLNFRQFSSVCSSIHSRRISRTFILPTPEGRPSSFTVDHNNGNDGSFKKRSELFSHRTSRCCSGNGSFGPMNSTDGAIFSRRCALNEQADVHNHVNVYLSAQHVYQAVCVCKLYY